MLSRLQITNYALIDNADIEFREGFNVITGETGAGKSIMLGALSLILGSRADSRAVSRREAKSVIEATFSVEGNEAVKKFCTDADIDWDPSTIILRREITPAGRSRTFINDTPVTLAQLREVAIHLVDIHSQHQNLLLASPEFQLQVLDHIAGNQIIMAEYTTRYRKLRQAVRSLKTAREELRKAREEEEFTRYQLDLLEKANLIPGELADLEQRRELLANLTEVKTRLTTASESLDTGHHNALSLLTAASGAIEALGDTLPGGKDLAERLDSVAIELRDIADTVADLDSDLDADPAELEAIEARLDELYSLQSRHHVGSVEELIELRDTLRHRLDAITDGDDTIADLEKEARRAMSLVKESAARLTATRTEAASGLAAQLRDTAAPLGMANLQVDIRVSPADIGATGADHVEYLFAFNKAQPLMPVSATASGGEISRLMLSLKSIIARHIELPAIIFDEIDTGVSGDVADRMGRMMSSIGDRIQVIAITHLPQVASRGATHFKVYKEDDDVATHTRIIRLDDDSRVGELALMLSGSRDDETARAAALSLLGKR
ncbi:MAG: DNA repair protein RecN [Candidatus Amulumruptor caecigallinarius]|nr:DNA repair protein RecN [Candidatus Amulumruptor caecigallinarius]MCM1397295.1 DNA repair protein RecN [Candidatus Amulumruptor caecigallinarius]MCM1453640.1 DNA repair protein RecN [bacterium]